MDLSLCLVTVLCLFVGAHSQPANADQCLAEAMAVTDPNNAVGEAVSNAFAGAASKVVQCGQGRRANARDVSGLSIAVSLAVSESRNAAEQCTAIADAEAFDTPTLVGEQVTNGLSAGLTEQFDGNDLNLANAWLEARSPDIQATIQEAQEMTPTSVLDENGCLQLSSLAQGLPTAIEIGTILEDAVGQILEAVQCGTNIQKSNDKCRWENNMFFGDCLPEAEAEPVPVDPVAPVDPVDPVDPVRPVRPSKPSKPSKPTEPTEPTEPVSPSKPTEPTVPTEPVVPTEPTEPTEPVAPTEPTEPVAPTEPTEPVAPTEPTEPVPAPVEPSQPTKRSTTPAPKKPQKQKKSRKCTKEFQKCRKKRDRSVCFRKLRECHKEVAKGISSESEKEKEKEGKETDDN